MFGQTHWYPCPSCKHVPSFLQGMLAHGSSGAAACWYKQQIMALAKFWGVEIDQKLNWEYHTEKIYRKPHAGPDAVLYASPVACNNV